MASFNFDDQSSLFLPQKNKATVPGPVWLPIVVPTELITTGPESFGNFCSMRETLVEVKGVDIINDVSGGMVNMFETAAKCKVPYILTFSEGGFSADMMYFFSKKIEKLYSLGVSDIILDPGFGFNKTMEQNFEIAKNMDEEV